MLVNNRHTVRTDKHHYGRYTVSIADGLMAVNMGAVCVVGPSDGQCRALLWNESVEVEMAHGFPILHTSQAGWKLRVPGAPHQFWHQAVRDAARLLQERIEEAKRFAEQQAIAAAAAAKQAMRAEPVEG